MDLAYLMKNLTKKFEKEKDIKFIEIDKRITVFENSMEIFSISENGVIKSLKGYRSKLFFDLFDTVSKTRAEII